MGKMISDPRQRLLDAGLKLFANRGYAGTAVQDITEEARVTKPTLYYYFESKEGLFQALVDQAMDERLQVMRDAAPPGKATVAQLTDIIAAMADFARRQPDLLRLTFAIAFAAEGEFPSGFKKHDKMHASYVFLHDIIRAGMERGALDRSFTVDELTQSYFHLVQHTVAITVIEPKLKRLKPPMALPPRMEPRRVVELFLHGAAGRRGVADGNDKSATAKKTPQRGTRPKILRAAAVSLGVALSYANLYAQPTNTMVNNQAPVATPAVTATNYPSAETTPPPVMTPEAGNAPTGPIPPGSASPPSPMADVRAVPPVVEASHPELALASPIARYAHDPTALDLQTCFQLTAVRDDSLKISVQDIRIAQAQMSQSIAALWPSFTASNSQQFIHYLGPPSGFSFTSFSGGGVVANSGQRNYESQSNINMTYTVFNGGQNYNNVGASSAAIAARRETLARDYQTIYQNVAQAFYNVLQYEGDIAIQNDLINALAARVDDLRHRVSLGRSRPSEYLQAETDLANARVTAQADIGSSNAALETLAFYTGIPSKELKLKETQAFPSVAQLEDYLRQSGTRPDILSDVETLRQSERQLDSARGELFPTVTAQGNYLASQDPVSNNVDATMTLQISMPIFDGGLILAQIHQAHETEREDKLNVEQLQRTADQDTRTAYANFNASVAQVVVLREATVLASKNLAAQVDDYRRGVVSNLDVLTALQDYQTARIQLHNANMQSRLDLINLHVAAGMAARGPGADNHALPISSTPPVTQP